MLQTWFNDLFVLERQDNNIDKQTIMNKVKAMRKNSIASLTWQFLEKLKFLNKNPVCKTFEHRKHAAKKTQSVKKPNLFYSNG